MMHLLCGLDALSFYEIYKFNYIIVICGVFVPYETTSLEDKDYVLSISVFPESRIS